MFDLAARARSLEEATQCLDLGFNILEITLPCPGGLEEEERWLKLASDNDSIILGHGPEEGNPADLGKLEKEYLPKLKLALEAASRLSCKLLTVHFWMESRWLDEAVISKKIELLSEATDWGADLDVQVNIENLSEKWFALEPVLDRIPGLGVTLDVGHAQLLSSKNTAPAIIERFFNRIYHLHLHDNNGGQTPSDDLHLPPGEGLVPFNKIFRMLKEKEYNRAATLELRPHQLEAARQWVVETWRQA